MKSIRMAFDHFIPQPHFVSDEIFPNWWVGWPLVKCLQLEAVAVEAASKSTSFKTLLPSLIDMSRPTM